MILDGASGDDAELDHGVAERRPLLTMLSVKLENWLFEERDVLPLWTPVGIAGGIILWQNFGDGGIWFVLPICALMAGAAYFLGQEKRHAIILKLAAVFILLGFAAIMAKSAMVASPILEKTQISEFYGRIVKVEHLPARKKIRIILETAGHAGLPEKIRVNMSPKQYQPAFSAGAIIRLRARLVPPAQPTLPGSYNFSRRAWFSGLGATGTVLGDISLYKAGPEKGRFSDIRRNLADHIAKQLPDNSGTIAITLATGERGSISDEDAKAMRESGMAHLLAISGLHVTAIVGAIFLLCTRILALFPRLALRFPVPIIAACLAALGAIGYTLLTGAQVPTVRSCIAALMILVALAMGRDALSLRLVAFGATIILLFWPETLAGPSFQLSFAAVSTIIILHASPWVRALSSEKDRGIVYRIGRVVFLLAITGLAIELVLAPIALFHFHKAGLYGALANVIAIPLTTFIVMPFEALALLFDSIGLGAPFWWVTGQGISVILALAHYVSALPGAVTTMPTFPNWAFACIILGGLWTGIFQTRARWLGLAPLAAGLAAMLSAPYPDMLVTGDGKHLALVDENGNLALLRARAGDYVRSSLQENAGMQGDPIEIEDWPGARCSPDSCVISMDRGGRPWSVLAIRSSYPIPAMELAAACKRVDIVVSDRWLPYSCKPRWIKADRNLLEKSGGLAFYLNDHQVRSVAEQNPNTPWTIAARKAVENNERARQAKREKYRLKNLQNTPNTTVKPNIRD